MTSTERLSGLIPLFKRIGKRVARYAPGGVVVAWVTVLTMVSPAAAQGLCQVPGAAGPLSLGFGVLVSIIALVAIFKFGGSFLKAITGGGKGNAKLRIGLIVAVVGLFIAVGADSIVPWLMRQLGGGPTSVNLGCMIGGGGGG
jgi:asparagine N-glycosylation enzyme membrane subunit Stt3